MRLSIAVTLLVLGVSTATAQENETPETRVRIARPGGPTLTVRWREGAAVLGDATSRDPDGRSHSQWLLSAIGPMTSVLERTTRSGGINHRSSARIEVHFHGGYQFDLDAFLQRSHRAGHVAANLLGALGRQPWPTVELDPARCPSRAELERSEGGLDYILGQLVGRGCLVHTAGLAGGGDPFARRHGPRGFAVAAYDPVHDRVTLDIEVANCANTTTNSEVRTVRSQLEPPSRWVPWLEAALARRGLFAQGQLWRIAGLSGRDAIAVDRAWGPTSAPHHDPSPHPATEPPVVLGRLAGPPTITVGGYDTGPQLELSFEVNQVLTPGGLAGDRPEVEVGDSITVHPAEGTAELGGSLPGVAPGDPPAAVRRAFPRLTRPGGTYLVVVGVWVERQRKSVVVPTNRRTLRFIRRHLRPDG